MKRLFFSLCAVGLSCAAFGAGPEVNIVPKPLSVTPGAGTFTVTASTVIGVDKNAELRRSARIFAGEVAPVVGGVMKTAAEGDVRLAVDGSLEAEAYTLAVTPSGVEVRGGTPQGVFHGLQSLRQLVIDGEGVVPAVTVSDKPYFAHRGGMLDPCRHFWTVDEVKEYIDILAIHKLNKFHWHLTDDQGWRIEIKKYPELTRVGSVRGETLIGHHHTSSEYDKTPHGGYYTQKQIREIVKYAADRYITVIPEIELPGHAVAALTSYPWLGCKGEGYEVRRRWGISKEVFCPGKETTFEFLQNVFAEVLELFPSEFIHIGGDECPKDSWKQCPLCQERIRTEGLKDEFELQSYTVRRMEKWLREHGRKIIGWDEILEGGVSPTATVMSWRGSKGGIAAAKAGNHVIMAPNVHCYLDYYQTKTPTKEPMAIGGYVPMRKVYELDPYDQLTPGERAYILGVQGNLWTEYIATFPHLKHMLLPRLAAIADAPAILEIYAQYMDTPITFETELPSLEEFEGRIRAITAEYPWIVCEDETGRIIGYAYGHKQLERAAYRWNAELSEYLDSRVTSKGIGKRMLLVLLELLKAQGVHTVYSLVTSPNVKSDAMHNGCGFRTMGVCKNTGYKSGKWHDVTWYEKALLPYEDVPAEMIPIGEMEKETVERILASF